jgi:uncharacterized protein YegJ (DUF2314 family)
MRVPFFGRKRGADALELTLPALVPIPHLQAFVHQGELPTREELCSAFEAACSRLIPDPEMRQTVQAMLQSPGLIGPEIMELQNGHLPDRTMLRSLGMDEQCERILDRCTHVAIVAMQTPPALSTAGIVTVDYIARVLGEQLGGVEFRPASMRVSAAQRNAEPMDSAVLISRFVTVMSSVGDRGLSWNTTSGLCCTGLPELEIRDCPADSTEQAMVLLTTVARSLAREVQGQLDGEMEENPTVLLPAEVRITADDMAHAYGAQEEKHEGARGWTYVRLRLHRPKRRDDMPMLELVPPLKYSGAATTWVFSAYTDIVGSSPGPLTLVEHDDEEMVAAHERAVAELPSVRQRFQSGLPTGHLLYVKYGLETREGAHEYVWCVVSAWRGERVTAQLASVPVDRPDIRTGTTLTINQTDIYDWVIYGPNEYCEGNYTSDVLLKRRQETDDET